MQTPDPHFSRSDKEESDEILPQPHVADASFSYGFDVGPPAPTQQGTTFNANLRPPAFLQVVTLKVEEHFRVLMLALNSHTRSRLAKFWLGSDPSIHYELALHERTSQLEIGLHLESAPDTNRALYRHLDRCMLEIQAQLGQSFWLEDWDRGWVRLYETQPLWPLDQSRADEVASRICQVISTLQPIYEAAPVPIPPR